MSQATPLRLATLSRNADFMKLWLGQTVSLFGSMITVDSPLLDQ